MLRPLRARKPPITCPMSEILFSFMRPKKTRKIVKPNLTTAHHVPKIPRGPSMRTLRDRLLGVPVRMILYKDTLRVHMPKIDSFWQDACRRLCSLTI